MELWPGFLVAFVIIRLVDFFLFVFFPSFDGALRPVYFSLLGVIAAFVLAQWAINKKYIRPLGIPQRNIKFKCKFS